MNGFPIIITKIIWKEPRTVVFPFSLLLAVGWPTLLRCHEDDEKHRFLSHKCTAVSSPLKMSRLYNMPTRKGDVCESHPMEWRNCPHSEYLCPEHPPSTSFGTVRDTENEKHVGPFICVLLTAAGKSRRSHHKINCILWNDTKFVWIGRTVRLLAIVEFNCFNVFCVGYFSLAYIYFTVVKVIFVE